MSSENTSINVNFTENMYSALKRAAIDSGTMHSEIYIKVLILKELKKGGRGRPPKMKKNLMNESIDVGFSNNVYKSLLKASKIEEIPITEWIRKRVLSKV